MGEENPPPLKDKNMKIGDIISKEDFKKNYLKLTEEANNNDYTLVDRGSFYEVVVSEQKRYEEYVSQITNLIQIKLDNFAKTRNYDGILSVCSYDNDDNDKFAMEAKYCKKLRSATWAKAYEILDDVMAGKREIPSIEEIMEELPITYAVWPI